MTTRTLKINSVVALLFAIFILPSFANDGYDLRYSTEKRPYDYSVDSRATFNIHADDLPLPGAFIDMRNIEVHSLENRSIIVSGYNESDDCITMILRQNPEWLRFGYDFFQLPPMEEFVEWMKESFGIGDELDNLKDQSSQEMTLKITPKGQFKNIDFDIPSEMKGKAAFFMPQVMQMISSMIEPTFPSSPVKIGESWDQNIKLDMIPFADIPNLALHYTLENVEKNSVGEAIGRIHFDAKWRYDIQIPNKFMRTEKIPYWEDKEFELESVRPSVSLKIDGLSYFNISKGYTISSDINTDFLFSVDMGLKKLQGHARNEIWSPHVEYHVVACEKSKLK